MVNFIEYISREEENFLVSMVKFRKEFALFTVLDRIYKKPIEIGNYKSNHEAVIVALHNFVHFYLYFSISCLMRAHLSESFSSMRKAIDAGLSAYKIILDPSLVGAYLDEKDKNNKIFKYIKKNIKEEIEKGSTKFALAKNLIKIHETSSQYGSHADISTFFHRYEIRDNPNNPDEQKQIFHYFQFPKEEQEYKQYFVYILIAFLEIFYIFKLFFDSKLTDKSWEETIKDLENLKNDLEKQFNFLKSRTSECL